MQKIISHIFIFTLFFLFPICLSAQIKKKVIMPDTVKVHFFNGISVWGDAVGAIQMETSDHGHYEGGVRINILDRYFPSAEIGFAKADMEQEFNSDLRYKTSAPYFRIGCDFNILRNKHDIYKMTIGPRYSFSSFKYDVTTMSVPETEAQDDEQAPTPPQVTYTPHNGISATYHWLEAVFGVDAKVWGPLHLGWDVRYRMSLKSSHDGDDSMAPWYIPGFGKPGNGFSAVFKVSLAL